MIFHVYVSLSSPTVIVFFFQTACLFKPHPVSGYVGLCICWGAPVDLNGSGIGTCTPPDFKINTKHDVLENVSPSPFKYGIIPIYVKLRGVHPKIVQLPFVWYFVCCSFHPHCNTQTVIMSLVLDLMPLLLLRFACCIYKTCIHVTFHLDGYFVR